MPYQLSETEHFAIQAKLASRLGPEEFQSLFCDLRIRKINGGTLEICVGSDYSADIIERRHAGLLAVIVESVVKKPVRFVTILSEIPRL